MAYINDYYFDLALDGINNANRLDICSQEPATYTAATSTYTLGNKTSPTISAPTDRSPSGRMVTVSAITDGSVTGSATATHWALSETGSSRLTATGSLSSSQAVTSGNTFTLGAFNIGIADAA